jgi:hypothetical protein
MSADQGHRSDFKNWILISDQGGCGFQTGGIHRYFEDLKSASNAEVESKDFFETLLPGARGSPTARTAAPARKPAAP